MRSIQLAVLFASAAAPLAGCSSSPPDDPAAGAPVLEITSPERGTMSDDTTLVVAGRATAATAGLRVTVNGAAVDLAADGSFTASVPVAPGIAILETTATDDALHETRDVRAVLAGPRAPVTASVDDGVAARIGASGLATVGHAIGRAAAGIDFTAAGQAMNPIYDNGGCLGARVDITSIGIGGIDAALAPQPGSIDTHVTLTGLVVHLHAGYKVACIGGSSDLTVRADRVDLRGGLGLGVVGGDLATSLPAVSVAFTGFDLDVGGLPGAVVDLFNGIVDDRVATALADAIRGRVPALADAALADLAARSYSVALLGRDVAIHAAPSQVAIDGTGAFVALDTRLAVDGGDGAEYLTTPAPASAAMFAGSTGLGVAIADDAANQLLAGLWAAGAFDQTIPADGPLPIGALLDDETATLELSLALPPTVATRDGALALAFGDAILSARDAAGEELQRFAVSLTTTLAAATSPDGRIELAIGPPMSWAQVLFQGDRVDRPLDAELVEGIVDSVWRLIGPQASRALAELPMPSVAGVTAQGAALTSRDGYVVVRADLVMP